MESNDPLKELLAVDHKRSLEFFIMNLRDVTEPGVDRQELLYAASVLAHYAQVPTSKKDLTHTSFPRDLTDIFDRFILNTSDPINFRIEEVTDPVSAETVGCQCLLMTGFFRDQMRQRHCLPWYEELGKSFFKRAAKLEQSAKKAELLNTVGNHFIPWRMRYTRLNNEFRDMPYLIHLPPKAS